MNFLDSLTHAEWQALTSVAHERTFARGSKLMREGDRADYVMVIISGLARISVQEAGRDRAIIERGPGQLIGEVGALRVNMRSATVTAQETVVARVTRTEDFTRFLDAHPRVLAIVERQIDERLTGEPYSRRSRPAARRAVTIPQPRLSGGHCTVILTDVVGFGGHERNDRDRRVIRAANLKMTQTALGHLWEKCTSTDQGDGFLIVVPPEIPTSTIMECLHQNLPGELRQHNRSHAEPSRIRLRVAVNVGPVMHDSVGITGEAIILTKRLLDAPNFKAAMASTDASLGMIVSKFVFDTTIRHAEGWTDPESYQEIEVNVKESCIPAWMQLTPEPGLHIRRFLHRSFTGPVPIRAEATLRRLRRPLAMQPRLRPRLRHMTIP